MYIQVHHNDRTTNNDSDDVFQHVVIYTMQCTVYSLQSRKKKKMQFKLYITERREKRHLVN